MFWKVFRICDWWKDRDTESDQYKIITDPDPVGPKTYGSGTLVFEELDFLAWVFFHTWKLFPIFGPNNFVTTAYFYKHFIPDKMQSIKK